METILAVLLLGAAAILQNTIVSRINLLVGAADLVLLVLLSWALQTSGRNRWRLGLIAGLFVGLSSALPVWTPVVGYVSVIGMVALLSLRIWQAPYWMLFTSTFFGTMIVYGFDIVVLWFSGYPFDLVEMFNIVILPSIILNTLLVLPVYLFVGEFVKMVSPTEVEV